ncbi:hypothetical protein AB1L05_09000 [Cytobacillus horneckiae]|uniref:hypothetical protein n=1 Tax=Cytobacillus horneckiae TaxID=549687 RepID=UPI0039A35434
MDEKHEIALAYVQLDKLRIELILDSAIDERVLAIDYALKLIRQKITGISE